MMLLFVIVSLILVVLQTSAAMRHQQLQQSVADGKALEVSFQLPKKSQHLHDCYQISSRCSSHRFHSINNFEEMKSSLEHCCVIEGDLQLLLLEKQKSWDNVSFPRLVEITGFLLVYRVYNLKSLGSLFPNLATIRGLTTHQGYSLILYDNRDLQEVGLYSLTSILNGYVRIQKNIQLCFGDDQTINWNQICKAQDSMKGNHFSDNYGMFCSCNVSCKGYCWSSTICQTQCPESCKGDCTKTGECCHEQCAGGCTKPGNSKSCIACKNYNNYVENVCVESCPERPFYRKLHDYLCINETECDNKEGYKFFDQGGECVKECPPGYSVDGKICKECKRNNDCGKPCKSQLVNTIEKAQTLRGCTSVNGTLVIRITGGREIAEKLENALENIERVTGYIRIFNSKSLLSLNFFKSLTYIGGETLSRDKYALYVHDNDNLENIWENRNTDLNIGKGKIFFHSNPKLCYRYVEKLLNNTNITMKKDKDFMRSLKEDKDFMRSLNGQKVVCNNRNLSLKAVPLHETGAVILTWATISTQDHRALIGYIIYYQASETRNLTRYGGRDACSQKWSSIPIEGSTAKSTEDYTLTGLTPATLYGIYIHTETLASADIAAWTNIVYVKTFPSNPGEVGDLKIIKAKETSLEISFFPPRQPNGVIQFYIITVTEKDWPNLNIPYIEKNCPTYPDQDKQVSNTDNTELQINSTVKEELQDETIDEEKHDQDISGNFNEKGNEEQSCCQCSSSNVDSHEQAIDFEDDLITLVYYKNREFQRQKREVWLPQSVEYMKPSTNIIKKKFTRVKRDTSEGDGIDRPECSIPNTNLTLQNHSSCENGCRIKTEKTKFTIDNLQYSTQYFLTVEACQEINASCGLCTKRPETLITATSPKINADLVQDLNISPINGKLINVTWKAPKYPNAPIIRYKLQVSNMENNNEVEFWCLDSAIFSETYSIKNGLLKPGLHYRIQVEALLSKEINKSYQQYPANRTFIVPGPLNAQNDRSLLVMGVGASALAFLCLILYIIWRWGLCHPYKDTKQGKIDYTINDNYGELLIIIDSKNGIYDSAGIEVPGHSAYMAIQNDPSTYWYPSGLEKNYNNWFITFNFKDIYRVSTINLQNYGDTVHDVKEFKLETSNDHSDWRVVYSDNNVRTGTKEIQKFQTCSTTCGQYWKLTVKATASGETPWLVLVNFYGAHISHNMNWVEILRGNIDSMYIHDRDKLVLDEKKLGEGHFGVVRKGILKWKGKEVEVAVKQLTDFREREKLIQEAKIMLGLECNHVVRTYGVVPEGFGIYLVMDLMIKGDLLKYLQSRRAEDNNIFTELTLDRVCDMAVQISDGMAYLAFKKIVHRDLAARNCLLDEKENVKISDFGMTRIVSNYYRIQEPRKIPVRWMPPEILQNSYFTSQSDVWSYGIVVWEIITGGCRPYKGLGDDDVVSYIKQGGTLKSDMPEDSPEFLANLVSRCWAFSEKYRPSFPEIIFELLPYTSPFFQQYFRGPGMSFYHSSEGRDYKTKMEEAAMLNSQCWESCSGPTTPLTATSRLGTSVPPMLPPRNNARHSLHSDMNSYPMECPSDDDTFNDLPYDTDYDSSAYAQKGHVMVRLDHSTSDGTTSSTFRPGYGYFADTQS